MSPVAGLRQESVVAIGEREVTVVSEVLLEPEPMMVTTYLEGARVLRRSHTRLPPTAMNEVRARGPELLAPTLNGHHLGCLRRLMSGGDDPGSVGGEGLEVLSAGMLGVLVLGPAGEVRQRIGEDQVPGGWHRAAYLVSGACRVLAERVIGAPLVAAHIDGPAVRAVARPFGDGTRVRFFDARAAGPRADATGESLDRADPGALGTRGRARVGGAA